MQGHDTSGDNGKTYEEDWKDGMEHGLGSCKFDDGSYQGSWKYRK